MPVITGFQPQAVAQLLRSIATMKPGTVNLTGVPSGLLKQAGEALIKLEDQQGKAAEYTTVETPAAFDALAEKAVKWGKSKTFALFTAALKEDGQPWCPDAREAEPFVFRGLDAADPQVSVLVCRIPREEWKNKESPHPYRAKVGLTNLPTLMEWSSAGPGKRLVEGECKSDENVAKFVGIAGKRKRDAAVADPFKAHAEAFGGEIRVCNKSTKRTGGS